LTDHKKEIEKFLKDVDRSILGTIFFMADFKQLN